MYMTPLDLEKFKASFQASVEAMTPEERKQLVNQICGGVDKMAKAIVDNSDALWQAHHPK